MISHAHLPFTLPCLRRCLPPVSNLWLLFLLFQIAWSLDTFCLRADVTYFLCCTRSNKRNRRRLHAGKDTLWLREEQRWWSWKLTRQLFLWLRLLFVERVEKLRSPRARWKNRENVLASATEIQANFLLFTKRFLIQEMLDCIVYSSFDVRVIR